MNVLSIIFITAVIALFSGVYNKGKFARYFAVLGLLCALVASYYPECSFFLQYSSMFEYGENAALFTKISVFITLLLVLLGGFAFNDHRSHQSELYALMLFSLCGAVVLFGYRNLVTLFIGIEILSIPLYVMAGSSKTNLRSVEASMKYLLMGAFATGFLLLGIALIYGSAGSFDIHKIQEFSAESGNRTMFVMGISLMMVAMAFKVSLAPFHMWSPDVYQGAPSLITAFMASVVKIAGFAAFFKLLTLFFGGSFSEWFNILGVLVIITLLVANTMGLAQTNAKRMLAYSSVSHAGYIALVFFGYTNLSIHILAFYLFAYSLATVGVFLTLIYVEKIKHEISFEAFNGLAKAEPLPAVAAAVSVLSMAGIPLTAGFVGKFQLFSQALNGAAFLVLIAVLASIVSIAYYLKLIIAMFFYKENTFHSQEKATFAYKAIAAVVVVLLIGMGVYPNLFEIIFGL